METLCFAKTYLIKSSDSIIALIILIVGTNIACLVSQSTTTRISIDGDQREFDHKTKVITNENIKDL